MIALLIGLVTGPEADTDVVVKIKALPFAPITTEFSA